MIDPIHHAPSSLTEALRMVSGLRQQQNDLEQQNLELLRELEIFRQQNAEIQQEHETTRLFISAIDQCSESIFFTDIKGKILYVNRSFEQQSGYTRKELFGQNPRILKSGVHPQEFYKEMWATILRGHIWRARMTNKRKDGTIYHEEANITPVRDNEGKITSFVSVKTDITELLTNQRALEKMNEELSRSNAELEQFAYVASHDLQEPLRSVSSCMQLLEKYYIEKIDGRADEFIRHAVGACQRMRDLIDGLLMLSRVHTTTDSLAPTDTEDVLHQVCSNLEHTIRSSGARIDHGHLPVVCGHSQMLIHLFQNLVSNALKFSSGQSPVVHVSAKRNGDDWVFSVHDDGIGIDSHHFERIFQLFQRLHTREEYTGTGLGLAICQKIIDQHGGRIWVESSPGKGSTFFFTLPAVLPAGPSRPERSSPCPQLQYANPPVPNSVS